MTNEKVDAEGNCGWGLCKMGTRLSEPDKSHKRRDGRRMTTSLHPNASHPRLQLGQGALPL